MDVTERLGAPPAPGEAAAEVIGAWQATELVGVVALRPCLVLEPGLAPSVVEVLSPWLLALQNGLMKGSLPVVEQVWAGLQRRRRRLVIDRREWAYALRVEAARLVELPPKSWVRAAEPEDLETLVAAARGSLDEEGRPDPFRGDPVGFRRWVAGRLPCAAVVEHQKSVVFVGYADVRRTEGWLLQGIYTLPAFRRRGFAAGGMSALCRQAFAAGADHVQLAVVEGNTAGERLYAALGFRSFDRLRTILFT